MATINGTNLPDILLGTPQDDVINGLGGLDIISGGDGNDVIDGGEGDDILNGNEGNDILIGGEGIATLLSFYNGGDGNDLMIAAPGGLGENFDGGDGTDTVSFAQRNNGVTVRLSFESLPLLDTVRNVENVIGSDFADAIYGDDSDNVILGGGGDDLIEGGGGADLLIGGSGDDVMAGGAGNDIYLVDSAADAVIEGAGQGNLDVVYTLATYTLAAEAQIEALAANDVFGVSSLNLTGNGFNQVITGNDGGNLLIGGGGADTLIGRGGNDIYLVDSASDVVVDGVGQGALDVVYTTSSFTLFPDAEIEALAVNDVTTNNAIDLTGNQFGQVITGNDGNNVLIGGGGNDVLIGRLGNDSYLVDSASDSVVETAGQGALDVVYTTVSYTLAAGAEIEVFAVNDPATTAEVNLTGNEFGQLLLGNAGDNRLDGGGGSDTLVGRDGNDTFAFTSALGAGNVDLIADFQAGIDRIELDDSVFAGLGLGTLSASAFVVGSAAQDADDRIIYDQATGALFFDADGSGAGAAVQFATLVGAPAIVASDIFII